MVYDKLCDFLSGQLGIDPSEIRPETNIIEDLGADSLDLVEMLTEMESEYNIIITDERARELTTVGEIAEFLEELINK
jgi:acyl carrier protein